MRDGRGCLLAFIALVLLPGPGLAAPIQFEPLVAYASAGGVFDVALSDVDLDGDLDAIVSNQDAKLVEVWLNDGAGAFSLNASYPSGSAIYTLVADLDADGLPDLAIANANENTLSTRKNLGAGAFGPATTVGVGMLPRCITTVDWNHDGNLELAVAEFTLNTVRVLRRLGPGLVYGASQVFAVGTHPKWITSGDLDGDGFAEVVTSNHEDGSITVLKSMWPGPPVRTDYVASTHASMVVLAQLNADTWLDAAVVGEEGTVEVLPGTGGGAFGTAVSYPTTPGALNQGIVAADLDADGDLDLAISGYGTNQVTSLANSGNGAFGDFRNFACGVSPRGLSVGDLDDDDLPDLAVSNYMAPTGGGFSILLNGPSPFLSGINLSWDDCGTNGVSAKNFACDANDGPPFTLVASFSPPIALNHYVGLSADLRITDVAGGTFPDWWKHGSGSCRGLSDLTTDFDFTSGPFSCTDVFAGHASGAFAYFNIGTGYPGTENGARLIVQAAVPEGDATPVLLGIEYYAFKVRIARAHTLGPGSCIRCRNPVRIQLAEIQLFQPYPYGLDPVLSTPRDNAVALWQDHDPTSVPTSQAGALSLSHLSWNGRGIAASVTLPRTETAMLEIFDASGRRSASKRLDGMSAGEQGVEIATRLVPGVYFARLTQGRDAVTGRFVVMQ